MSKLHHLPTGNIVWGKLPLGCRLCLRGRKAVVFITGLCPRRCFYCPLSTERRGKDVFLVNDLLVKRIEDLIMEVAVSGAEGAGLTGGDPLVRKDRTLETIRTLKREFGEDFHIHLYTSGATLTGKLLEDLYRAGLDELRLHPKWPDLNRLLKIIEKRVNDMKIGLEIPVLPGNEEVIRDLIRRLEGVVNFLNMNELEFSETNYASLLQRGYELREDWVTAKGSRETALKVLDWCLREKVDLNVHFCPALAKDKYQSSLRLYRRAIITARPYEAITDYGSVVYLVNVTLHSIPPKGLYNPAKKAASPYLSKLIFKGKLVEELASTTRLRVYEEDIE